MGASLQTLKGHVGGVNSVDSVAFSPDGWLLASGGRVKYGGLASDGVVRLWDPKTGASLQTLKGHLGGANSVAFSPDYRLMMQSDSQFCTVKLLCLNQMGVEMNVFN